VGVVSSQGLEGKGLVERKNIDGTGPTRGPGCVASERRRPSVNRQPSKTGLGLEVLSLQHLTHVPTDGRGRTAGTVLA
jgi:hypothetical protein